MNRIWIAIAAFSALGMGFGLILGYASCHFNIENDQLIEKVDELLPQSQCGQCGYPGCRSYAEAMVIRGEKINCCSPGGEEIMLKIASFLNVEPQESYRDEEVKELVRVVALIDEPNCIGCTKCIHMCPVDAIIGATGVTHTVMADLCTGCNLCVLSCPMQCISLRSIEIIPDGWKWDLQSMSERIVSMD